MSVPRAEHKGRSAPLQFNDQYLDFVQRGLGKPPPADLPPGWSGCDPAPHQIQQCETDCLGRTGELAGRSITGRLDKRVLGGRGHRPASRVAHALPVDVVPQHHSDVVVDRLMDVLPSAAFLPFWICDLKAKSRRLPSQTSAE